MRRKHKLYERPKKLYDSVRIKEEDRLVEKYGLKNKREIWKSEAAVRYLRNRAKKLIIASKDEQDAFFKKLNSVGLNVSSIADVLALTKENLLKRRLATILVVKKLARTPREGRQFVVHKRVMIHGKTVSSPGYLVHIEEESLISVRPGAPAKVKPIEENETPEAQ